MSSSYSPQPCKGLYQLLSMNRHAPIYGVEERQDERAATLSGLMGLLFVSPRVAHSSQPWAERCNPFGIERNGPAPSTSKGDSRKPLFATATEIRLSAPQAQHANRG